MNILDDATDVAVNASLFAAFFLPAASSTNFFDSLMGKGGKSKGQKINQTKQHRNHNSHVYMPHESLITMTASAGRVFFFKIDANEKPAVSLCFVVDTMICVLIAMAAKALHFSASDKSRE